MKQFHDLAKFILTVLLMGATIALAAFDPVNDDTDIFLANPAIASERPNVLIVLDNTANWNNAFANEKNALVQVVNGLTDAFNVGWMMFPETGSPNDSVDGGYVRFHVRQMTLANKSALATIVNNFDILNDKGNNSTVGLALHEAYLYYAGKTSIASHGKIKTDKDSPADPLLVPLVGHALPAGTSPGLYRSPIADGCARNFIIYISNGPANENAAARADLQTKLAALTGVNPPNVIGITPNGQQANWADEMSRFMANADVFATSAGVPNSSGVQNVYTYVVEVDPGSQPADLDMTALMKSVASNGKGKYFAVSSSASGTAIVDALNKIFAEVQAVNSVFAAATLPVSVNVRGANLNQVYIGVFRPDATKSPRWLGNLKMYNLALDTTITNQPRVFLADAANGPPPAVGNEAENNVTGFVSQNSPSFWTVPSTFWGFRDPSLNGVGGPSDYPDGDLVEKGGAAQQLRIAYAAAEAASPKRNLYTCTTGLVNGVVQDCAANTNFSLSNTPFSTLNDRISAAALQLDTRLVSPLTAFDTKPVITLTDRKPAILVNSFGGAAVTSLANGATTLTITKLTTATPKVITSVNSDVPNAQSVNINNIQKVAGKMTLFYNVPAGSITNFINGATVVVAGSPTTTNNGSWTISAHDTVNRKFEINVPGNNDTAFGGTATVTTGIRTSTTAFVTLGAHGYVSGQQVTISGATPINYNVPNAGITVTDADHFQYSMVTAPGSTGNATGTITASGNTTTATATTSVAHGFTAGNPVTIYGASIAGYNGTKTIAAVPSATTFTYCVGGATLSGGVCTGGTAIAPDTNSSNVPSTVFAVSGGGTTVTVTTSTPHGFVVGNTAVIAGSDIAGYNGSWRVASCGLNGVPIACIPLPPGVGLPPKSPNQFTFNTATDNIAPTVAITTPLPANTSTSVTASPGNSATVVATIIDHGFFVGAFPVPPAPGAPPGATAQYIVIDGAAPHAGTWEIISTTPNTITYTTGVPLSTPTGNYTARNLTNHRATATVTNHGYGNPGDTKKVMISGAVPAVYNTTDLVNLTTATIVDANTFSYALPSAPGPNTSPSVTSSVKTTLARATAVNHGFLNGSSVAIAGAVPTTFNGTYVVTVTDANHFTYTIATEEGDAAGAVTAAQSGGSSADRDLIIRWVRGEDNFEDENINLSSTDVRASIHGDVLHSRPAVINYNRFYKAGGLTPANAADTKSDDDVFIFYGANDGVFHAVKGGYTTPPAFSPATLTPGREAWGFIPEEFFSQFKRMRNNAPTISSSFKKPYFMDGSIGVYVKDTNSNGKLGDAGDIVNLYIANRRGVDSTGRGFYYGLDVNNPVDPKFLFRITATTPGFSELGESWSQPTVVTGLAGLSVPVLVFGAGYDAAVEDVEPKLIDSIAANGDVCLSATCTVATGTRKVRTMGRGIYVVNALTGALIWSAGKFAGATKNVANMHFAIPSDVTIIRNDTTGIVNRAYVGDTGGNMWRIDFRHDSSVAAVAANPNNLDLTIVTKLASIADPTATASYTDTSVTPSVVRTVRPGLRKFLFPPDVVGQTNPSYDAVLIGSGDREHPFDTTVVNRFYMFKDKGGDETGPVAGNTEPTITEQPIVGPPAFAGLSDLTSNCIQEAAACTGGETQANVTAKLGTDRGWFITLGAGEKSVGNAISIGGVTFFNTNQPSATAGGGTCGSNLGVARQYQVSTADATATSDLNAVGGLTGADRSLIHAGGGYLPSPVLVVVMLDGKPVEAIISGVQVSTPTSATLSARLRKYWYKEVDPK